MASFDNTLAHAWAVLSGNDAHGGEGLLLTTEQNQSCPATLRSCQDCAAMGQQSLCIVVQAFCLSKALHLLVTEKAQVERVCQPNLEQRA